MIRVCLGQRLATYFDIHSDTEGEIEFVVVTLNAICPDIVDRWRLNGDNPTFDNSEFDRWEIVWCIDDEEGWPLAHKVYNYIKDFEFDVEIVKGTRINLGQFGTEQEAHNAWLTAKLEQAKLLAAEQTDPRIAKALIERYENYEESV